MVVADGRLAVIYRHPKQITKYQAVVVAVAVREKRIIKATK